MGKVVDFNKHKGNSIKNDKMAICEKISNSSLYKNSVYILIGIPNSGKSTYADNLILNQSDFIIVSTDEIRNKLTGTYEFSLEFNQIVFEIAKKKINNALMRGFNVVYDATNTNKKYRKSIINIAKKNNAKTIAVIFKTPLTVCLNRNSMRNIERRVPEDVILAMSKYDSNISKLEGFEEVIEIL